MSQHTSRDQLRSSVSHLGAAQGRAAVPAIQEQVKEVRASVQDASWTDLRLSVLGMSNWRGDLRADPGNAGWIMFLG